MAITSVGDCQVCKCGDDERDLGYYTVAPLATELLECLPGDGYFRTQQHWQLEVTLDISLFNVAYVDWYENTLELVSVRHENLAEALAQMLIYLVENDYVKFNETKEDENR